MALVETFVPFSAGTSLPGPFLAVFPFKIKVIP